MEGRRPSKSTLWRVTYRTYVLVVGPYPRPKPTIVTETGSKPLIPAQRLTLGMATLIASNVCLLVPRVLLHALPSRVGREARLGLGLGGWLANANLELKRVLHQSPMFSIHPSRVYFPTLKWYYTFPLRSVNFFSRHYIFKVCFVPTAPQRAQKALPGPPNTRQTLSSTCGGHKGGDGCLALAWLCLALAWL